MKNIIAGMLIAPAAILLIIGIVTSVIENPISALTTFSIFGALIIGILIAE